MVPFRLILILPPILGFAGTLVSLFISYSWLNYFGVVKWLPKVVLGFAVLSAVFTVLGVLSALTTSPGGGSVGGGGDAAAQIADAQAKADKMLADAKEATDKAGDTAADAKEAVKDAKEAAKDAKEAKEAAKDAKKPPKEAVVEKPPKEEKEVAVAAPPPGEDKAKPPEKTTVAPVTGGGYGAYAQMRESIEKRITDDPTLLKRTSGLLEMYSAYETEVFEIESRYTKDTQKKPASARVNNHLRDAELYEKTGKTVKDLYGKLK